MFSYFKYEGGYKMKVFISWSGETSFQVAKILKEWIPCVIQGVEPYFSSEDIDKGARWSTDIAKELETASFGILCVTKENLQSQWLNFEAGALSKAIDKAKVCPLLYHLKPSDISDSPILQFQMTNVDKDDMFKLFKSINNALEDMKLDEARLEKVFSTFWPEIEKSFIAISDKNNEKYIEEKKNGNRQEILEEMLDLLRSQQMLLKSPEKLFPIEYMRETAAHIRRYEETRINRDTIPKRAIAELDRAEMVLANLLTNDEDNVSEELRQATMEYIICCHRVMKIIGFNYPQHM